MFDIGLQEMLVVGVIALLEKRHQRSGGIGSLMHAFLDSCTLTSVYAPKTFDDGRLGER